MTIRHQFIRHSRHFISSFPPLSKIPRIENMSNRMSSHHQSSFPISSKVCSLSNSSSNKNTGDEEWKLKLSPEAYYVLREKGTERPFSGKYNQHFENGVYHCAACHASLFKSSDKFKSHCGWPAFTSPLNEKSVLSVPDNTLGLNRTEIKCAHCDSHLGHVFDDGPSPLGTRYCINSVALDFKES